MLESSRLGFISILPDCRYLQVRIMDKENQGMEVKVSKKTIETVQDILKKEDLKELCSLIMDEEVDNIILIYRRDKRLCWGTTINSWGELIGNAELGLRLIYADWVEQMEEDSND